MGPWRPKRENIGGIRSLSLFKLTSSILLVNVINTKIFN